MAKKKKTNSQSQKSNYRTRENYSKDYNEGNYNAEGYNEEDYNEEDSIYFEDSDLEQVDIYYDNYPKDLSKYNLDDNIEEDEIEDSGRTNFFHLAFLLITIILVAVMIVFLLQWNKGKKVEITEDDLNSFDSESEDHYSDFDPYVNPAYVDDGEYNIVILGDDTISNCTDETSIPNLIAKKTGANVTTFAIPGATCAIKYSTYNPKEPEDFYSFFYIANRIASQDFEPLKQAWDDMEDPTIYYEFWDAIHNYDFSKADAIIICYGSNDLLKNIPMIDENPDAPREYGTATGTAGALDIGIAVLKDAYPNAQIIVSSPSFFLKDDGNGGKVGADLSGYGCDYGNLGGYVTYMLNAALYQSVSFIDNYYGLEFNASNYKGYLTEDGRYPNEKGREILADHIANFLYFYREKTVIAQ